MIHVFETPEGYDHYLVTVAIRLGYPESQLNMVYFFSHLTRKDGIPIGATQVHQQIDGKGYQRWSRHRSMANPWNPKGDNLESYVILVED